MHHTVTVRTDMLRHHANTAGVTSMQLASRFGMSQSTMSRITRGLVSPSPRFIAAALATFDDATFDDLFTITQDPEPTA